VASHSGGLFSVGVDVGGTFTDLIAFEPSTRRFRVAKVPSTPGDQSVGFMKGLRALGAAVRSVDTLIHGTTVGTNAILERKGARCGLITTRGFRDALELGRRTRPQIYGMGGVFEALIPRELRVEVTERLDADGRIVEPLAEEEVRDAVRTILRRGAEALVIHFLHSYRNPVHEEQAFKIARDLWPTPHISVGSRILREVREFERGSTAAVNAYVQPVIARYVGRLERELARRGFRRELLIMQGNGGTMGAGVAGEHATQTVMSGPAAGAIGSAHISRLAGFPNVISCDMGGTSFDVAVIRDSTPLISAEKEISYAVPVRVPMIDIHTIGAGGGSIAEVNHGGILQVGPESAGATPGPICYGRGGELPTVTDAHLVLGRLNPRGMTGVTTPPDVDRVRSMLEARIGRRLGLDATQTAAAILAVVNVQMASAIRLVSIERGHDPRDFALLAFGGAGPLHAVDLARELGVPTVIVPCYPGITSALGCVLADIRHDFVQYLDAPMDEIAGSEVDAIFAAHAAEGRDLIARERVAVERIDVVHEVDIQYMGQSHVFRILVSSPGFDNERTSQEFARHFRDRFDIELTNVRTVLVNARTAVLGRRRQPALETLPNADGRAQDSPRAARRQAWFGSGWHDTAIYRRQDLREGQMVVGPAIVEQADATTVIDPVASATVDRYGNLIIAIGA
jgi:N-methylhydantoinase A